ncbi:dihydropteroate synthase [Bacteroidota bacterium]
MDHPCTNKIVKNRDVSLSKKEVINCGGKIINLSNPLVMGIVNVTPDSFYDGGKYNNIGETVERVREIIDQGAGCIDIGAYSSRPGADIISAREELKRLDKSISAIRKKFPDVIISIDTFRAEIAKKLVAEYDVNIINDISGGEFDAKMFDTVAELQVPYILMYMKGTLENMHLNPGYSDLLGEIIDHFQKKIEKLLTLGVNDIIIDPGFGFGKTMDQNYQMFNELSSFNIFGLPLLSGISRKSMIYKYLEISSESALNGTTVLNAYSLLAGVNILRVHDVKEAVEVCRIYNKLKSL